MVQRTIWLRRDNAQAYVEQEMQWDWAKNVEAQIERESRTDQAAGRANTAQQVRHPGKTARDKAKHSNKK